MRIEVLINHERVALPGTDPPQYTAAFRAHEDAIAWTRAITREYYERYALRGGRSWPSNREYVALREGDCWTWGQ